MVVTYSWNGFSYTSWAYGYGGWNGWGTDKDLLLRRGVVGGSTV